VLNYSWNYNPMKLESLNGIVRFFFICKTLIEQCLNIMHYMNMFLVIQTSTKCFQNLLWALIYFTKRRPHVLNFSKIVLYVCIGHLHGMVQIDGVKIGNTYSLKSNNK
jgi:hypothetical protein